MVRYKVKKERTCRKCETKFVVNAMSEIRECKECRGVR